MQSKNICSFYCSHAHEDQDRLLVVMVVGVLGIT